MPTKGTSKVTHSQRTKIAAGRLAGKGNKEISAETGLALSTIEHQVFDTRTLTLMQRAKQHHEPELLRLIKRALVVIKKGLYDKDIEVAGRAVDRLRAWVTAGDPPLARLTDPAHDLPPGDFLVEEALLYYRRIEKGED